MSYQGDIIVVGVTAPASSAYDHMFGLSGIDYRFAQQQELTRDDSGFGGGDSNNFVDALLKLISDLLSKIFDKSLKTVEEVEQAETRLATQFDPDNVDAISKYTTESGKTGTMWNMKDKTTFWDTNDNGKVDYHTKFGADGHLYGDDGDGWKMIN